LLLQPRERTSSGILPATGEVPESEQVTASAK